MENGYDTYWELIIQVLCGEADAEQQRQLQLWLEAAPEHRQLFRKAEHLLAATKKRPEQAGFDSGRGWAAFLRRLRKRRLRRWALSWSAAAAVGGILIGSFLTFQQPVAPEIQPGSAKAILVIGDQPPIAVDNHPLTLAQGGNEIRNDSISGLVFHHREENTEKITYSTLIIPKGGEYKVTLPDGTQVWLNAESELHFPSRFTGDCRLVNFTGEGYFRVAKDSLHPFRVLTGDAEIKVYGTEFNLYAYQEEKQLAATLVRGSVSVTPAGQKEVRITPSQRLSYSRETGEISVEEVDTQLYTSWKDGVYTFENTPLREIFHYLKRWYAFEVTYAEERLQDMRFTGEFPKDQPISYGLNLIRLTCDVNFIIEGEQIRVIP